MKKYIVILFVGFLIYLLQTPFNAFGYVGIAIGLSTLYYWVIGYTINKWVRFKINPNHLLILVLIPNLFMELVMTTLYNPALFLCTFPFSSIFAGIAIFQGHYFDYKRVGSWLKFLLLSLAALGMVYFITPHIAMYKNTKQTENNYVQDDIPLKELNKQPNIFIKKGKTYYLDFFHTKCGYCILKFKDVEKIHESFKGDTNVCLLTIADGRWDSLSEVVNCEYLKPYHFKTVYDSAGIFCKSLNLYFYPQSMIIDKNGKIAYHFEGYSGDRMRVYKDVVVDKIKEVSQ